MTRYTDRDVQELVRAARSHAENVDDLNAALKPFERTDWEFLGDCMKALVESGARWAWTMDDRHWVRHAESLIDKAVARGLVSYTDKGMSSYIENGRNNFPS